MPISVRLPTVLRPHAGGESKVATDGDTIADVVKDLVDKYPAMASNILTEGGEIQKFVNVYVNDEDVRYLDKLDTKVSDGDEVAILPAVAGG